VSLHVQKRRANVEDEWFLALGGLNNLQQIFGIEELRAAGREVFVNRPIVGKDLNDSWRAPNE